MSIVKGLEGGYGTPIVVVKTPGGKNIYSSNSDLGFSFNDTDLAVSLVSFSYEYIDDSDDACNIVFETQHKSLPDHPSFKEGEQLIVNWGYIGGAREQRLVRINRIRCRYMTDKIILDIGCSDSAALISLIRSKKNAITHNTANRLTSFVAWFKATFGGSNFRFKVIMDGIEVVGDDDLRTLEEIDVTGDVRLTKTVGATEIPIMDFLASLQIADDGRTAKQTLEEGLKGVPGGPVYIDSRDGEITIHNRTLKFAGEPRVSYKYRGESGDVISIHTDIKDKEESINASNGSGVDEDDKSASYEESEEVKKGELEDVSVFAGSFDTIGLEGGAAGDEQRLQEARLRGNDAFEREAARIYISWLRDNWETDGVLAKTLDNQPLITVDSGGAIPGSKVVAIREVDGQYITEEVTYQLASETTQNAAKVSGNSALDVLGLQFTAKTPISFFLDTITIESILHETVINEVRRREQLSRTSDIVLLGDPRLRGRDLIRMTGVASEHGGKHYVMKCKHTINSGGYVTKISTYQESPTIQKLLRVLRNESIKKKDGQWEGDNIEQENSTFVNYSGLGEYNLDLLEQNRLDAAKQAVQDAADGIFIENEYLKNRVKLIEGLKAQYDATLKTLPPGTTFDEFSEDKIKVLRPDDNIVPLSISNPTGPEIITDYKTNLRYYYQKSATFDLSTFKPK